jgi:hypothetical protein
MRGKHMPGYMAAVPERDPASPVRTYVSEHGITVHVYAQGDSGAPFPHVDALKRLSEFRLSQRPIYHPRHCVANGDDPFLG